MDPAVNCGRLFTERLSGAGGVGLVIGLRGEGSGVSPRAAGQHKSLFFSSQHYSQGRNCVFLCLCKAEHPFIIKSIEQL